MMKNENDQGAGLAAVGNDTTVVPASTAPHVAPTPGPWTVGDDDRNGQAVIEGPEFSICACHHHCLGSIEDEMRANAHLISAAPELLAACKKALRDGSDAYEVISAAVAKAEGRQS